MAEPDLTQVEQVDEHATPVNPFQAVDESPSPSPEHTDEETIYSLLFQECDSDDSGHVAVESLVEYIHKMQSGQQDTSEEVYDSLGESQNLKYNLDLLKAMLECNSDEHGRVDQATYSHVIRMWVKNIRDRDEQTSVIEVTQLSDSEDGELTEQLHNFSYGSYGSGSALDRSAESFETSGGGNSSTHVALDRVELMNSVADLRLDNKRLQERNQELQIQLETSDEHFKSIQKNNTELQGKLKNIHQNLTQLEQLKTENLELNVAIQRERENHARLEHNSDKLERDLNEIRGELDVAREQLANAATDQTTLGEEMQQRLLQKEEQLLSQEVAKTDLASQLLESQQQAEALSHTVTDLTETNDELKSNNADLQTRLQETQARPRLPFSSTPYRREVPSLHDELMARDEAEKRGSISPFLVGGAEGEGLQTNHTHSMESVTSNASETSMNASRVLDESFEHYKGVFEIHNPKIHQRSTQLVREFTDIIAAPSPSASHRSTHESSRIEVTERMSDRKKSAFESRLTDLVKRKKQLQNENAKLVAEMDELRQRNEQLEREKEVEKEQHVQDEVDLHETAVQTDPCPSPEPINPSIFASPIGSLGQPESPGRPVTPGQPESPGRNETVLSVQNDTWSIAPASSSTTPPLPPPKEIIIKTSGGESSFLGVLFSAGYRILKGVALLLLITLLVLLLFLGMILVHDSLDSCGSYCPHSPVQMLYNTFGSHLQYSRVSPPI